MQLMEPRPFDQLWDRGRTSLSGRVTRLRSKTWAIAQCSLAAGVAWFVAADVFGPPDAVLRADRRGGQPRHVVRPAAAAGRRGDASGSRSACSSPTSWSLQIGSGGWQLALIVALAMSSAFLLDGGQLSGDPGGGAVDRGGDPDARRWTPRFIRWTDALIGGAVALVAATVVPAAPLRRPREQAAVVVRKIAELLRAAGELMVSGDVDPALALLADARDTDYLIRELQDASAEGLAVVASSPFRVRHRGGLRRMADLVDPLDRALRSTRVLVRHTAVAAYRRRPIPASYAMLARELAAATDEVADELAENEMAVGARIALRRGRPRDRLGRALHGALGRGGARPAALGGRRPAAGHRHGRARGDRRRCRPPPVMSPSSPS